MGSIPDVFGGIGLVRRYLSYLEGESFLNWVMRFFAEVPALLGKLH